MHPPPRVRRRRQRERVVVAAADTTTTTTTTFDADDPSGLNALLNAGNVDEGEDDDPLAGFPVGAGGGRWIIVDEDDPMHPNNAAAQEPDPAAVRRARRLEEKQNFLADLSVPGMRVRVCRGGRPGRGNGGIAKLTGAGAVQVAAAGAGGWTRQHAASSADGPRSPSNTTAPPHPQLLRWRLVPGLRRGALLRLDSGRVRDDARGHGLVVHRERRQRRGGGVDRLGVG